MAFEYLLLLISGLVVGSFLGALTYRWPRGISIRKGRSLCPNCKKKISWYDNIPVVSYLLLGGKCRNCGKKVSLRYPLIELGTSLGFLGIGYFATTFKGLPLQGDWALPYLLLVFSVLVAIFVIDFEHQVIPDSLVFFLLVLTSAYLLVPSASSDFYLKIVTGFFSALFLLIIHLITKGRGMGLGDVKFALFGGMFAGWPGSLVWFLVSFLTGATVGIILILLGRAGLKQKIAFGPFLIIGLAVTFIWGNSILKTVLGLP